MKHNLSREGLILAHSSEEHKSHGGEAVADHVCGVCSQEQGGLVWNIYLHYEDVSLLRHILIGLIKN